MMWATCCLAFQLPTYVFVTLPYQLKQPMASPNSFHYVTYYWIPDNLL